MMAVLTLQYPDYVDGRLRTLASSRDTKVLRAFRDAVMEQARLNVLASYDDDVLRLDYEAELERLEALFALLVPCDEGHVEDERG